MCNSVCSTVVRPTQRLPGPDSLVTDGTRNLTLTCPAESSGEGQYTWFTPGKNKTRCETQQSGKVCIFIPRLEDDNQNVSCTLVDPGPVISTSTALYQVNMKYPPQSSPNISIEPSQTEPLKQGDVITCTVSGGKPRVTTVTFHCQHPDHADREDDVSDDRRTVSSFILVDNSQATEVNMTCTCSAYWDPEPGLYSYRTTMEFELERKNLPLLAFSFV
ncbi:hypothetical protein V1264_017751 [Littorina saxatilis]|uniref:Ig-like domain-containing protein n=1 Tax=Littorina saxatilis TaxID=31220 RepID=A0AAN9GFR2_9CAEN